MTFLQELQEARLTKDTRDQKNLSYSDCCEKFYLIILILEAMRHFPNATPYVRNYCGKSLHYNYKNFKIMGTDAYNLLYFLTGDDNTLEKLKDPQTAKRLQASVALPLQDIKDYFKNLSKGHRPFLAQQFFIRLENGLQINNSNYRSIRRNVHILQELSNDKVKEVVTQLLFAARTKLTNSDIIEEFSKLIAVFDLESPTAINKEPVISQKDPLALMPKDLMYYRLFAKNENLMLIKNFLKLAQEGKPIPGSMVKAYFPLIEAVHDIISAGPTFVRMLKVIQDRAKNTHNK